MFVQYFAYFLMKKAIVLLLLLSFRFNALLMYLVQRSPGNFVCAQSSFEIFKCSLCRKTHPLAFVISMFVYFV